jgi:hypothetical protein
MTITIGSFDVQPGTVKQQLLTMLLWGKPGCGKTVLAGTAPGKRLWLQFDPAGTASLTPSDDNMIVDLSGIDPKRLDVLKQGTAFEADLVKLLRNNDNIKTVIVDSLTSLGQAALTYAILSGKANKGAFKATLEDPGQSGFGVRLAIVQDFVKLALRACADYKKHCIFICHEKDARAESVNGKSMVVEITMNLGGQLNNNVGLSISELWYVEDTGKQRLIYLRNHGVKRPMRTRMFLVPPDKQTLVWEYDQATGTGDTIAKWYAAWQANGFNKLPLGAKVIDRPAEPPTTEG